MLLLSDILPSKFQIGSLASSLLPGAGVIPRSSGSHRVVPDPDAAIYSRAKSVSSLPWRQRITGAVRFPDTARTLFQEECTTECQEVARSLLSGLALLASRAPPRSPRNPAPGEDEAEATSHHLRAKLRGSAHHRRFEKPGQGRSRSCTSIELGSGNGTNGTMILDESQPRLYRDVVPPKAQRLQKPAATLPKSALSMGAQDIADLSRWASEHRARPALARL